MTDTGPQAEALELSARTQKFVDTSIVLNQLLEAQRVAEPQGNAADYSDSIARAELILRATGDDATHLELGLVVDSADEPKEVAHERELIESLRDDPDFGIAITEDDIDTLLDQLPVWPQYRPEVAAFAQDYLGRLSQWVAATTTEFVPVPEPVPAPADAAAVADGAANNGEAQTGKPELTITVYKDRAIRIGNGDPISLFRLEQDIFKDAATEISVVERRLKALKAMCGYEAPEGERGMLSAEVWAQYADGDESLNSAFHAKEIVDFLAPMQHDGKPIVSIHKPTPESKRRYHQNGAFSVKFVESDERSGLEETRLFEMPSDAYLFGFNARIANLFIRGTEEHPISQKQFEEADVYTAEEQAKLSRGPMLSSAASVLRRAIEAQGLGDQFNLQSKRVAGDREMFYWLEFIGDEQVGRELYPFLYTGELPAGLANDDLVDLPGDDAKERLESQAELAQSIKECQAVTKWLTSNHDRLVAEGYKTEGTTLFQPASQDALSAANTEKDAPLTPNEMRAALASMSELLRDEVALELVINKLSQAEDDPRWPLIDFLLSNHPESGQPAIERLPKDFVDLDHTLDSLIITTVAQLQAWKSVIGNDKNGIAEAMYDILGAVSSDWSRQIKGTPNFREVIKLTDRRIAETTGLALPEVLYEALIDAHDDWTSRVSNFNPRAGHRARKRAWTAAFKNALDRAFSKR